MQVAFTELKGIAIQLLREKGMGIKQIARELKVGIGTVHSAI